MKVNQPDTVEEKLTHMPNTETTENASADNADNENEKLVNIELAYHDGDAANALLFVQNLEIEPGDVILTF